MTLFRLPEHYALNSVNGRLGETSQIVQDDDDGQNKRYCTSVKALGKEQRKEKGCALFGIWSFYAQ